MNKHYLRGQLEILPQYLKHDLLNIIKSSNEGAISTEIEKSLDSFLESYLENDKEKFIEAFLKLLLDKRYKYSSFYELKDKKSISEILMNVNDEEIDIINLSNNIQDLKFYKTDDKLIFLFLMEGMKPENNEFVNKKTTCPVIVSLHEIEGRKFVEFDIDSIPTYFRVGNPNFFVNTIQKVVNWLRSVHLLVLEPVNLTHIINRWMKLRQTNETTNSDLALPQVSAQRMNLNTGSQATLDVANSANNILPILGELKQLIKENIELFEKNNEIKELIETYISEIEDEADLPWISLKWDNEIKDKAVQVKFMLEEEPTLLNYYYHSNKRSGMNDVTNAILSEYCDKTD